LSPTGPLPPPPLLPSPVAGEPLGTGEDDEAGDGGDTASVDLTANLEDCADGGTAGGEGLTLNGVMADGLDGTNLDGVNLQWDCCAAGAVPLAEALACAGATAFFAVVALAT